MLRSECVWFIERSQDLGAHRGWDRCRGHTSFLWRDSAPSLLLWIPLEWNNPGATTLPDEIEEIYHYSLVGRASVIDDAFPETRSAIFPPAHTVEYAMYLSILALRALCCDSKIRRFSLNAVLCTWPSRASHHQLDPTNENIGRALQIGRLDFRCTAIMAWQKDVKTSDSGGDGMSRRVLRWSCCQPCRGWIFLQVGERDGQGRVVENVRLRLMLRRSGRRQ